MAEALKPLVSRISPALLLRTAGYIRSGKAHRSVLLNVAALADALPPLMSRFYIDTPMRIAHFLAQLAHESDSFNAFEEYASGADYEGRKDLGNVRKGDGRRYKGRSPMQVTGRINYRNLTAWIRSLRIDCPDFEAEPERLTEFPWAAWACVWYWETRKLNVLADRDDLIGITRVINGGKNGLAHRAACLSMAKDAIAEIEAFDYGKPGVTVLHRGSSGDAVEDLQRKLQQVELYHGTIDGEYGPATEQAVRLLQGTLHLTVDGIFGPATSAAFVKFGQEAR